VESVIGKLLPFVQFAFGGYVVTVVLGTLFFVAVAVWVVKGLRDIDKPFDKF
jgi:hypothetical protein